MNHTIKRLDTGKIYASSAAAHRATGANSIAAAANRHGSAGGIEWRWCDGRPSIEDKRQAAKPVPPPEPKKLDKAKLKWARELVDLAIAEKFETNWGWNLSYRSSR